MPSILWKVPGHGNYANSVAFSPNGSLVASCSSDGTAKMWDANTGLLKYTLVGHKTAPYEAVFSPDNTILYSVSPDSLKFWRVSDGALLRSIPNGGWSICLSSDGSSLVIGYGGQLSVRRRSDGALLRQNSRFNVNIGCVRTSKDGKYILVTTYNTDPKNLEIWNYATLKQVSSFGNAGTSSILQANFSPDSKYVCAGTGDNKIRIFSVPTGSTIRTLSGHTAVVNAACYNSQGTRIASTDNVGAIKLWNPANGALIKTMAPTLGSGNSLAFNASGSLLLANGIAEVNTYNTTTGAIQTHFTRIFAPVYGAAYNPSGSLIATATDFGELCLWRPADGSLARKLTFGAYLGVDFSKDGLYVAAGDLYGKATIWKMSNGSQYRVLSAHSGYIKCLAFTPDSKYLITSSGDSKIKIWLVSTGALVKTLSIHNSSIYSLSVSPNSVYGASGDVNGYVKLWRVADGAIVRNARMANDPVTSITFNRANSQFAWTCQKSAHVMQISNGAIIRTITDPQVRLASVVFSKSGSSLVTGGFCDPNNGYWNVLKGWKISDGSLIKYFNREVGPDVFSLCYSPDGSKLAIGRSDGVLMQISNFVP